MTTSTATSAPAISDIAIYLIDAIWCNVATNLETCEICRTPTSTSEGPVLTHGGRPVCWACGGIYNLGLHNAIEWWHREVNFLVHDRMVPAAEKVRIDEQATWVLYGGTAPADTPILDPRAICEAAEFIASRRLGHEGAPIRPWWAEPAQPSLAAQEKAKAIVEQQIEAGRLVRTGEGTLREAGQVTG